MSTTSLLSIQQLSLAFPRKGAEVVTVVDGVSLQLERGECLGIVGESGSGKSLTALSIMQLLPDKAVQTNGELWWQEDRRLDTMGDHQLQQLRGAEIGMIFQEPLSSLNPVQRCGEQISESIREHQSLPATAAKSLTLDWLAKVQLRDPARIYEAFPHQLSGGQRQRVMIAMALCNEPELLIADEPTTALDVTVQRAILDLLKSIQAETGIAIIFISHDLGVVKEMADRVMVMQSGRVVEQGLVQQIFANPQSPYTKGLLACRPTIDQRLERLPTIQDFDQNPPPSVSTLREQLLEAPTAYRERQEVLKTAPVILRAEDVVVRFPKTRNWLGLPKTYLHAVDKVSIELRQGECLGIVGESGSGKTTLGRALLRLVEADAGSIWYDNRDIRLLTSAQMQGLRPQLQMVFQDPFNSLNPAMTVQAMLEEPLWVFAPEHDKASRQSLLEDTLHRVGLDASVLPRYAKAFSGGQRQRISIARALLMQPRVLICDESVSALDVSVQAQVLNLIKELQATYGFSLLFITHDLGVVKHIADRIIVMQHGKIVEEGATEALFQSPQESYTQHLLKAVLQ